MPSWLKRGQDALSRGLAVLVAVGVLVPAVLEGRDVGLESLLALVVGGAVALRRRRPLVALASVQAVGVFVTALGVAAADTAGYVLAYLVLLYTVGAARRWPAAVGGVAISLAAFWCEDAVLDHPGSEYLFSAILVGAPWLVGRYVRRQHALRARLIPALDGERLALAAAAVAEERQRIAREMHDVVAHGLSAIAVQSNAADAALTIDIARARAAVQAVNMIACECVAELRRVLAVLRQDSAIAVAPSPPATRRTSAPLEMLWGQRDGAVAALVAATGLAEIANRPSHVGIEMVLVGVLAAAVFFRRRATVSSLAAIVVLAALAAAIHRQSTLADAYLLAALVLMFTAGSLPRRRALPALALGLIGFWSVDAITFSPPAAYAAGAVIGGGAWLIGLVVGREQALRVTVVSALDGERQALCATATTNERRRIAREMHDVVAHGLSAIAIQSSAADAVLEFDPARAAAPIRAITVLAEQCAQEMRWLLAALGPDRSSDLDLSAVLSAQAELGLRLELQIDDDVMAGCPVPVRHAAARIVQEALTNVRRHSAADVASVSIHCQHGELAVVVTDDGPVRVTGSGAPGHGTAGIRERVAVLGGRCQAGPRGPGWYVDARIPLTVVETVGAPA